MLIHAEISTSTSANCIAQDRTSILQIYSTSNNISIIDRLTYDQDEHVNVHEFITNDCSSQYGDDVIEYICGFIVKQLKKKFTCGL